MSNFEGFSEVSMLYAEKYSLVRQMATTFDREREQLFGALAARVVAAPWFDAERLSLDVGKQRFDIRLRKPLSKQYVARIQIYLSAGRLGRRSLYSDLWLVTGVPDLDAFRRRLEETVPKDVLGILSAAGSSTSRRDRYIIRRTDTPFGVDTLLDTMFGELENLQQLFPYIEQLYRDLGEIEG